MTTLLEFVVTTTRGAEMRFEAETAEEARDLAQEHCYWQEGVDEVRLTDAARERVEDEGRDPDDFRWLDQWWD